MTNNEDNFEWARRLECPASATTDSVKKVLNQGIGSLLWDELAGNLYPTDHVLNVRKNILLYKLKHGEKDTAIQHLQSVVKIRAARSRLDPQIESLEEKCDKNDFLVRQKQQQLSRMKSQRHLLKIKEDILRMKLNEMKNGIEDCKKMRSVCQDLMPANSCQIDPNIVNESLSLVSVISNRTDKKMALNRISENLSGIELSTLWNILLSRRTRDTEYLMDLGTREISDTPDINVENMEISISRACGKYMATTVQEEIHRAKNIEHNKLVLQYIDKIEALETNGLDISEWLALTLEVRKFETEQKCLEIEIDSLKKTIEHQCQLTSELNDLESDIHNIRTQMESCMQDIQKSFVLLKPAGTEIARTREKLQAILQKIVELRADKDDVNYMNIDPSTELNTFHDTVNLEALDKIILKDKIGAYRHTKFCMSEALCATSAPSQLSGSPSEFPMIRAPVYQLINCYKILVTASWLARFENESDTNELWNLGEWLTPITKKSSSDTIEILNTADLTCDKVREEIIQFDSIFDAWKYQTVKKAMALNDAVVAGATFKEWVKRYDTLLHMVRKNK